MNRLPHASELSLRRPSWVEGTWITLSDGQSWSFPRSDAVPGYAERAEKAAQIFVDNLLPFINIEAIKRDARLADEGSPEGMLARLGNTLAMYKVVYWAGSTLLQANYFVTDETCDRLMPFDYNFEDLTKPDSKLHRTTPETLAMCNSIAAISDVNVGELLSRIAASN